MASALPGLARRRDRVSRAVATALRDAALGRLPADERAWVERIEAGRRRISAPLEIPVAVGWMSLPPAWGRFLIRLVRLLRPESCIELGTGFGLSTAYQAAALELNGEGRIVSFDVAKMLELAEPGLAALGLGERAEFVRGDIAETLPDRLGGIESVDFALIDHDHTAAGTLAAFDVLRPRLAPGAAVVFDDIGWTEEMRTAWTAIAARDGVAATIDAQRVGVAVIEAASAP